MSIATINTWDRVLDRIEGRVFPDPSLRRVANVFFLHFARRAVVNVIANVFFIGENLADGPSRPGPAEIREDALGIQHLSNLRLLLSFFGKLAVHPADRLHFFARPCNENDSVRLDAFVLPLL